MGVLNVTPDSFSDGGAFASADAAVRHGLRLVCEGAGVLDVGGDPVGARALGSMSDVVGETEYDLLLVLNRHRPFMDTVEGVIEHAQSIVAASCLRLTGVISNTHMLDETTVDDAAWGLELARPVAAALGVPVRLLSVPAHLAADATALAPDLPVVAIRRRMLPEFLGGVVLAAPRPLARKGNPQ